MFFILLPLCLFLLLITFYSSNKNIEGIYTQIRVSWLKSLLVFTSFVYAATETLSVFNTLNAYAVILFWAIICSVLLWLVVKNKWRPPSIKSFYLSFLPRPFRFVLLFAIIFGLFPLLFLSIYSPPNNLDSINYHLSRIISWTQNNNVEHFATSYMQQLYLNVLGEYLQMHVYFTSGNDRFVNLVQFTAMCSSVLTVGLIGKHFGLGYKSQFFVSILLFTMPIGLFESTTTQIDYVACLYFLIFVYFGLVFIKSRKYEDAFFMGLALVFGCFTKYPIFFYALPFCIWIAISTLFSTTILKSVKVLSMLLLCYILVFSPLWYRNYRLFGAFLSPPQNHALASEDLSANEHGFRQTISGISKNIGLHVGLPYNPYNRQVDKAMTKFHELLGVEINDQATSRDDYRTQFIATEDAAGNFLLLILITFSALFIILKSGDNKEKIFLICTISGFIIFCSVLKFQHWSSRTQMPFFALGTVLVGMVMAKQANKIMLGIMLLSLALCLPYIYGNPHKPLLSVRYLSKYVLGYAPSNLCVQNENEVPKFRAAFDNFYDFDKRTPCFPPKKNLSYFERVALVSRLDNFGYYEAENISVFQKSRIRGYFMRNFGGKPDYEDFIEIMKFISPQTKGIAYKSELGFYDYWAVLKNKYGKPISIQYIGCHKEFQVLPNEAQSFEYNYILTNDLRWVESTVPTNEIKNIVSRPTISLVILKRSSTKKYYIK